jgi:hypothetical protein
MALQLVVLGVRKLYVEVVCELRGLVLSTRRGRGLLGFPEHQLAKPVVLLLVSRLIRVFRLGTLLDG